MIAVIDYGMGNLGSIVNMFKKVGIKAIATSDLSVIGDVRKLVLPDVGAFDNGPTNYDSQTGSFPLELGRIW